MLGTQTLGIHPCLQMEGDALDTFFLLAALSCFGLWSVYFPPSSLGPVGLSIVPGTISRGSLGFRDRLPAERGPGTG